LKFWICFEFRASDFEFEPEAGERKQNLRFGPDNGLRRTILMRLIIPFLIACYVGLPVSAADDGGLIANPGFEKVDAESGFATAWTRTYWSNPHGKVTLSAEARTGEHCVEIRGVPPEKITDGAPRNNNLVAQRIDPPIKGVRKLRLEFWFRAAANASVYCSVMTHDSDGNRLQYVSSTRHSDVDEWTRLIMPVSTAPETAQLTIYLRNDGEGPVWIDDVSLTASDDVLENDLLLVHIEPLVGGRLRSMFIKRRDRDATFWEGVRPGGMAADVVPGDDYPGLLRDAPCNMDVLEKGRRVRLTHGPLAAPLDGLLIEKEFSLRGDSSAVDVHLRVSNKAGQERSITLRAQQCLPPRQTTVTVPMANRLRVLRHDRSRLKWGLDMNDLNAGWIACSDAETNATLLFLFDRDQTTKAQLYRNQDLQTVEWNYREATIPASGVWQTSYTIAVLHSGSPIAAVSDGVAIGLSPLAAATDGGYSLAVSTLRGGATARVTAAAEADAKVDDVGQEVTLKPDEPAIIRLPWQGTPVRALKLSVRAGASAAAAVIASESLDTSPLTDLPASSRRLAEFPAATEFFPYGEYFRGYVGDTAGSMLSHVRRQLRAYRRCYMNTYMTSESGLLSHFKRGGTVPMLEEIRKRRMRVIPRGDMLRRFERDPSGRILRELAPDEPTREAILARLTHSGFTLDLRRDFVKAYGDLVLAYDFSDEPQGQYIPNYMMLQGVYREVDPDHPVLVILNLNRTEFLPFMPIYYGDEYPIRNEKRGGRNPWAVSKMVRFCATHTKAPVWVMLQAFGGLAEYTWQLPNKAEMRLTIYEAVANGCKGLTFHGSSSPPCWRYNMYYFDTASDSWGVEAPAWEAMREAGRVITAIGPALLGTRVSDDKVLNVQCAAMTDDSVPYCGPAIKSGVLRQRDRDGWFAVVVNQDIERAQRGTLSVDEEAVQAGSVLYDLCGLAVVGSASSVRHTIELAPGDGRIFFLGAEEEAASVLAKVHKGHYDNELPLYELDAEVAVANGYDVARAEVLAAEACETGEFAAAHEKIAAAREEVRRAIAANTPLSRALTGLSEAQAMLSDVALTYRRNFDVVMPPDLRNEIPRNAVWNNERDPKLQGYVDQTAKAMCLRMKLEDKVYVGEAAQVLPQIERLKQTATRLQAEAIPYVLSRTAQPVR